MNRKSIYILLSIIITLVIIIIVNQADYYNTRQNIQKVEIISQNNEKKVEDKNSDIIVKQLYSHSHVPILLYHSINDELLGLEQLSVRKCDFEKQIKYLL